MAIRVTCDSCLEQFTVSDERAGKRVKCKLCGEPTLVVAKKARGTKRASRDRDSDNGGSSKPLLIGIGIGVSVVIAVGGFMLMSRSPTQSVAGDRNLANQTTTVPQGGSPPGTVPVITAPSTAVPAATRAPDSAPNAAHNAQANNGPSSIKKPTVAATVPTSSTGSEDAMVSVDPEPTEGTIPAEPSAQLQIVSGGLPKLELPDLIAKVEPAVVRINVVSEKGVSTGSGYVVDDMGTVITNYHVIEGAQSADVEFNNKSRLKVVGYKLIRPKHDIAVIQLERPKKKLPVLPFADKLPQKGAGAVAFGAPLGLSFTATSGSISAIRLETEMQEELGANVSGTWLQTDCSISPGNSGGPLTDYYGRLIGMNTMQLSSGQNLNFAISAMDVAEIFKETPASYKPLKPEDLKPFSKSLDRKVASDETSTPRGQRLMANIKQIAIINVTTRKTLAYDPTGAIWKRVVDRSNKAVAKSKLEVSYDNPAPDMAVMMVRLELKNFAKGTPGTQELIVTAELICPDLQAKKTEPPICLVWKNEMKLGTIALAALATGNCPQTVQDNLGKFFSTFRNAYSKAVKEKPANDAAAGTGKTEDDDKK